MHIYVHIHSHTYKCVYSFLAGNQPLENVQTYLRGRLCVGLHNFQVFIHFVLPSVPERSRNLEGTIPNARESQNTLELYPLTDFFRVEYS